MKPIVVAGITNMETAVQVEGFPIDYTKSRFVFNGVHDRPGGVGYNVAHALAHLGAPVQLATLLGGDLVGGMLEKYLASIPGLGMQGVLRTQPASLRTVIAVDPGGRGAMFTDLKDSQEIAYPADVLRHLLKGASLVHATTINWALAVVHAAKEAGITVSTDVQSIRSLDDPYNVRFLRVADIVFISGENLEVTPQDAIRRLWNEFDVTHVLCTLGERGAILGDRITGEILHQRAVPLRPARNVTGAGDTFAAAFLANRHKGASPREAMLRAQLVAGWRIGEEGGGHGLPDAAVIDDAFHRLRGEFGC